MSGPSPLTLEEYLAAAMRGAEREAEAAAEERGSIVLSAPFPKLPPPGEGLPVTRYSDRRAPGYKELNEWFNGRTFCGAFGTAINGKPFVAYGDDEARLVGMPLNLTASMFCRQVLTGNIWILQGQAYKEDKEDV